MNNKNSLILKSDKTTPKEILLYKLAETIGNGKIFNIPYLILLWILLITIASFFLKNQMMESSLWGWI